MANVMIGASKSGPNAACKANKILGPVGRLVGSSKTIYRFNNPDNLVIYNSNIATLEDGKIWFGDIDVTKDLALLSQLAISLSKRIYVLYETDARFENESVVDNDFNIWSGGDSKKRSAFDAKRDGIFKGAAFSTDGLTHTSGIEDYRLVDGVFIESPDYSEHKITQRIRFSDIDIFDAKGKSKKGKKPDSPLEIFAKFVCKRLKIKVKKDEVVNLAEIVVTKNDDRILMYLCRRWLKANFRVHEARIDNEIGWMSFLGPSVNHNDDLHLREGYLYVKDLSKLIMKRQKE